MITVFQEQSKNQTNNKTLKKMKPHSLMNDLGNDRLLFPKGQTKEKDIQDATKVISSFVYAHKTVSKNSSNSHYQTSFTPLSLLSCHKNVPFSDKTRHCSIKNAVSV